MLTHLGCELPIKVACVHRILDLWLVRRRNFTPGKRVPVDQSKKGVLFDGFRIVRTIAQALLGILGEKSMENRSKLGGDGN